MAERLRTPTTLPVLGVIGASAMLGVLAGRNPMLALAATLALAFCLIAIAELTAGACIYTALTFLNTGAAVRPVIAAAVILGISWLAHLATAPEDERTNFFAEFPAASAVLLLFAAWATLSLSWAEDTSVATYELWSAYGLNFILLITIVTAMRDSRRASYLLAAYVAGATITSLYGLALPPETTAASEGRFTGGVGDPNVLAAVLIPGVTLAAAGFLTARGQPLLRLAAGFCAVVCLIGFFLTASRGGLIALGVSSVVAVAVGGRWRPQIMATIAVLSLSAFFFYAALAPQEIRDRIAFLSEGSSATQNDARLTTWQVAVRVLEDNPGKGIGVGNFNQAAVRYVLEPGENAARADVIIDSPVGASNTYLHVLAEQGLVGGALFLSLVAFALGCAGRAITKFRRSGDQTMEILARALLIGMVGLLVASFFISMQTNDKFWILLALGPGLLAAARRSERDHERTLRAS